MDHGQGHKTARPSARSIYDRYPIEGWKAETRLLKIHPGAWNDAIVCSLRVVSLTERPIYRALSYVWGHEQPSSIVWVEHQEIRVSGNLFAALRRLRAHGQGETLTIFVDALCINQSNSSERNHQVTLMGAIYSQCLDVIVWLGELESASEASLLLHATNVSSTRTHARHPPGCHCMQKQWILSAGTKSIMKPSEMAMLAAPILLRIAKAQCCGDFLACHLFEGFEDMIAFRFLMHFMSENDWFYRMWTVQEVLLPRSGSVYLGPVAIPVAGLFALATNWESHRSRACCRNLLFPLGPVVAPVAKACFFLGKEWLRVQKGYREDLFAMRIEYPNRRASMDVDLLYGLLGITKTDYGISPDYDRPVEQVYTDASKEFLLAYPEYMSFWIFIYAPLKQRYAKMPSWAVDWTTLEAMEYQNGRYTWTGLQNALEWKFRFYDDKWRRTGYRSPLRRRLPSETKEIRFYDSMLVMYASYVDTITCVGEVVGHAKLDWYKYFREVLESWRELIFAHHAPEHTYQPIGKGTDYSGTERDDYVTWAMAWLKVLCAGHLPVDDGWHKLSFDDLLVILKDARQNPTSLLVLRPNPVGNYGKAFEEYSKLYQKVIDFIPQILEGKRIFLTSTGYFGFGNIKHRSW